TPTAAADCIAAARASLARNEPAEAVTHALRALGGERSAALLRAGIRILYDAGDIPRAASLLDEFTSTLRTPGRGDDKLIRRVRQRRELIAWLDLPRAARALPRVERRVVNLLAYSLPYSSVGYATRSHGLAQAVRRAGW